MARLAAYRAAVAAGFYTDWDGSALTTDTETLVWLRADSCGAAAAVYPSLLVQRPGVLAQVLGLLGFAFLFTAGGALLGAYLGMAVLFLSLVGTFGTMIALIVVRGKAPWNLLLLYAFATFGGMALGLFLDSYVARGLGQLVLAAAATTAAVLVVAGVYSYSYSRKHGLNGLSGLGGVLFVGLIGVVSASLLGLLVQAPLLYLGIAAVVGVLFTRFLVYDLNRLANVRGASEGEAIWLAVAAYLDILNLVPAMLRASGAYGSDQ